MLRHKLQDLRRGIELCSCGAVLSAAGLLALQGGLIFMAERSADALQRVYERRSGVLLWTANLLVSYSR